MKKLLTGTVLMILSITAVNTQTVKAQLDRHIIRQTVEESATLLAKNYVDPEKGKRMKDHLLTSLKKGRYDQLTNPNDLAVRLKNELQDICNDKHVYINVLDPSVSQIEKPQAAAVSYNKKAATFQNLKILPGNIGYVEINHFIPTQDAITDVVATMNYLSKSDAVIFDLRRHRGGNGEIVQIILSYLFGEPTLINTIYDRSNDTTYQIWTHKIVSGTMLQEYNPSTKKFTAIDSASAGSLLANLTKADIYVLTSDFTFSAGEEFAYDLQSLKRATIVGSVTGAGGNPTRFYPLNQYFVISIPWARSINPVTGKGWEAEGVVPDIAVHPSKALETAHHLAINKLIDEADENTRQKLNFDMEVVKSLYQKVEVTPEILQQYAGDYGEYRIFSEEGILYSKRGRYGKLPLEAIAPTRFLVNEDQKIEFTFDGQQVTGMDVVSRNGNRNTYRRIGK